MVRRSWFDKLTMTAHDEAHHDDTGKVLDLLKKCLS
jgi:hypothetical protein